MIPNCSAPITPVKPTVTFSVLKPTVTSRKKTSPAKMQTVHGIMQTALQARQDWNPVISITARETSSSRIWTAMARLTVEKAQQTTTAI